MKFVPLNKQSKKQQKAYHQRKRGRWGDIRPVTRVVESKKAYSRERDKANQRKGAFDEDAPFP